MNLTLVRGLRQNTTIISSNVIPVVVTSAANLGGTNVTTTKVLCVGDSTTVGGYWPARMLALQSNDDSRIAFLGTQGSAPVKYEAYNGVAWHWYATNASSPFVSGRNRAAHSSTVG